MPSAAIRIVLADDHAILRAGVASLISSEPDLELVAQASSGEEAVEHVRMHLPDVVVMDLEMPGIGGLEATRRIRQLGISANVIVLTSHSETKHLIPVLKAGASGFVRKSNAHEELIDAIRQAARDEASLSPAGTAILAAAYRSVAIDAGPAPLDALSRRELQVLTLTAQGYTAAEAGRRLHLSPKTIETYRSRMMKKLGLTHRSGLVRVAIEQGLLQTNGSPTRQDEAVQQESRVQQ